MAESEKACFAEASQAKPALAAAQEMSLSKLLVRMMDVFEAQAG